MPLPKKPGPPIQAKAKSIPQAKGVIEEGPAGQPPSVATAAADSSAQEALFAEAARLLEGVSLKPMRLGKGWLRTAVAHASDPAYVVDSAERQELEHARVIRVDLASGMTELHVNRYGTLLSSTPCQVIIPAGSLCSWDLLVPGNPKIVSSEGRPRPL